MSRICEVCGKSTTTGKQIQQRGRPKRLGGVGLKTTGVSKRKFKPNVQQVRVLVNGIPKRMKVCTQCIKMGKVTKYVK